MKRMNLQLFAGEAVSGKKIVYLYRVLSKAASVEGKALAFTTENGRSKSKDADSTMTKDGPIRTPGAVEEEITVTSLLKKGDTLVKDLEKAMDDDEKIEIWEANLEEPISSDLGSGNKFKGRYFQAYITEFEMNSAAEDYVEISLTFGVIGTGYEGDVTVSAEQQAVADYVFKDTTAEA